MTDPKRPKALKDAERPPDPKPARPAEPLTERVADWRSPDFAVDPAAKVARGVALCGPVSRNGYRYPEPVLRAAVPLYEGVPVFLDHPAVGSAAAGRGGRSARDLAGSVTNARFEGGRLRGDVAALDTEAGRTFLALAAGNAPQVGMSHVVLAERTADGREVARIERVLSVDAVAFPATTDRLRESSSPGVQVRTGDDDSPAGGPAAELAAVRAELAAAKAALAGRAGADAAVEAAGLPAWAATAAFRTCLAAAATDADRRALAEDRAALIDRLRVAAPPEARAFDRLTREARGAAGPVSRPRAAPGRGPADAGFAAAVRAG